MYRNKWIYSGKKFKNFLLRNGISYKVAATQLGIDKNTVGRAVRGGNLSVDTLLLICNEYDLKVSDFFVMASSKSESEECGENKKVELMCSEFEEMKEGLERNIALLNEITGNIQQFSSLFDK